MPGTAAPQPSLASIRVHSRFHARSYALSSGHLARCFLLLLLVSAGLRPARAAAGALDLLKSGQANAALQELQLRINKDPSDAEAWNLMGRVYYQMERWDDAIHAAAKAVELRPSSSEFHQWLGRAYGEKADSIGPIGAFSLVRKVKNEFEHAVALDTKVENLAARSDLAEFYIEAPGFMGGDKTKAAGLARFVTNYDPALGHYIAARLAEKQKNHMLAEQEYKAANEASGDSSAAWINLASFYRRTGRLPEMESAVNQALAAHTQNSISLFDGASLLLRSGRNFPGAIDMLRRYLALDTRSEDGPAFEAHFILGTLLEKQKDKQAALNEYRAALALASQYKKALDALARVSR
ncbi:MAG TPA: tetratricopeptide repeat protein [Candidatus Saccharimonadales bacterium]|jgi:tetratricopeptide (TPR) repeat protein|nr:tetratricopeptide repeat protein [Candidatus Saccharimonadales bacterium]